MNLQQAQEALDLLERASRQRADQRYGNLERQLDAADRVIAQAAQLAIINDDQQLPAPPAEVLKEANPI